MRKGEDIRNEISFDGVEGLNSTQLIRAIRNKAFGEDKADDPKYMVIMASLCFDGPAMEWFEHLDNEVQTDWFLLRRALLERFPASGATKEETVPPDLIFTGNSPKECEDFVRGIRKHSHAEGKFEDDKWMAHYAAGCMAGGALKWHAQLDAQVRNSWVQLERALLTYFPEPPPYGLAAAGKILVERWERTPAPSFIPMSEGIWLQEARQRRAAYDKADPEGLPSVNWLLVEEGESIPPTAIETGLEPNGLILFSTRTWYKDGLHPGKTVIGWRGSCVSFGDKELWLPQPYEILVGDASRTRWINNPATPEDAGNAPSIQMRSFYAVEGGRRSDGTAFLLVQGYRKDCGWQLGKVCTRWQECEVPWAGGAHALKTFRIMIWAE